MELTPGHHPASVLEEECQPQLQSYGPNLLVREQMHSTTAQSVASLSKGCEPPSPRVGAMAYPPKMVHASVTQWEM